jgi:hypothetical protein
MRFWCSGCKTERDADGVIHHRNLGWQCLGCRDGRVVPITPQNEAMVNQQKEQQ